MVLITTTLKCYYYQFIEKRIKIEPSEDGCLPRPTSQTVMMQTQVRHISEPTSIISISHCICVFLP